MEVMLIKVKNCQVAVDNNYARIELYSPVRKEWDSIEFIDDEIGYLDDILIALSTWRGMPCQKM